MSEMSPEVMARFAPAIEEWVTPARFPGLTPADCYLKQLIFDDRSCVVEVRALREDGDQLLMTLDPAERGLTLIGNELVTLEDPGRAFAPLDPVQVETAETIADLERFLHDPNG